ncbi:MAG: hypothetical protein RBU37_19630 [Myxococcota bacterium]|jgi:hypothetical protein|nr:hypothetical protein [Myxococcota bacterium]
MDKKLGKQAKRPINKWGESGQAPIDKKDQAPNQQKKQKNWEAWLQHRGRD